jgi:hypothetical protein
MNTTTTTATKATAKVRTAPAIPVSAEDFPAKVRTALAASVSKGVGEVRVKVEDPSDRASVRKVQKKIQAIGYSAGWNSNFRVTLAGDILTGKVVDLTVTDQRPGHTDPTAKTPGTRSTFHGWTPAQISAWKKAHPVKGADTPKVTAKTAKKVTPKKVTTVRKVTAKKVTTTPDALKGLTSATPVDTATVTTRKVTPKKA